MKWSSANQGGRGRDSVTRYGVQGLHVLHEEVMAGRGGAGIRNRHLPAEGGQVAVLHGGVAEEAGAVGAGHVGGAVGLDGHAGAGDAEVHRVPAAQVLLHVELPQPHQRARNLRSPPHRRYCHCSRTGKLACCRSACSPFKLDA